MSFQALEEALRGRHRRFAIAVATRTGLRLLPILDAVRRGSALAECRLAITLAAMTSVSTEEEHDRFHAVLTAMLTPQSAASIAGSVMKGKSSRFANWIELYEDFCRRLSSRRVSNHSLVSTLFDNAVGIQKTTLWRKTQSAAVTFLFNAENVLKEALETDCSIVEGAAEASEVFRHDLWLGHSFPPVSREHYQGALGEQLSPFWQRWYQAFLDGEPLGWELQRQIALIPSDDWNRGPAHIARLIAEIEARHEVRLRAEEARALLAGGTALTPGIGHNFPPEPMDDSPLTPAEFAETEQVIERVLAQVKEPIPDKKSVGRSLAGVRNALEKIGIWCAKKADMAVDEFVKNLASTAGKVAVPALAAYAAGVWPKLFDALRALAKALENWLPFLH